MHDNPDEALREALSALADGEADGAESERGCAAWRDAAAARAQWHAIHVIGDALRSPETALTAAADAAFLARLRERLADEPVPLAPGAGRPRAAWRGWSAGAAIAAGFAAVATVVVATRGGLPATSPGAAAMAAASAPGAAGARPARDPRLDVYLAAHKPMRATAVAVSASAVR